MVGTAVYWHATINPRCGIANVSIDDNAGILIDASNGTTTNSTPIPAILFGTNGLASGKSHSINITFVAAGELRGPYLEVYNISCVSKHTLVRTVTLPCWRYCRYTQDNAGSGTSSSTSESATSSTGISSNAANAGATHHSNKGAIVGGVVGGILAVLLVLGLTLLIFRRRKRTKPGNSSGMSLR